MKNNTRKMNYSGWFLDTGRLDEIEKWKSVIGGITTNQMILFKKENILNLGEHIKKICKLVGKGVPVSVELPDSSASFEEMIKIALKLYAKYSSNVVVKVPIVPNSNKGLRVISELSKRGIPTNATIGINEAQLLLAAEAARYYKGKGDNYISLFWNRARESVFKGESNEPARVLKTTIKYLENHGLNTKIIVGSIRKPDDVIDAFENGADIVTVPPEITEKVMFTSKALDTLKEFDDAYLAVKDLKEFKLV